MAKKKSSHVNLNIHLWIYLQDTHKYGRQKKATDVCKIYKPYLQSTQRDFLQVCIQGVNENIYSCQRSSRQPRIHRRNPSLFQVVILCFSDTQICSFSSKRFLSLNMQLIFCLVVIPQQFQNCLERFRDAILLTSALNQA